MLRLHSDSFEHELTDIDVHKIDFAALLLRLRDEYIAAGLQTRRGRMQDTPHLIVQAYRSWLRGNRVSFYQQRFEGLFAVLDDLNPANVIFMREWWRGQIINILNTSNI